MSGGSPRFTTPMFCICAPQLAASGKFASDEPGSPSVVADVWVGPHDDSNPAATTTVQPRVIWRMRMKVEYREVESMVNKIHRFITFC
jgi:hypothetical protein